MTAAPMAPMHTTSMNLRERHWAMMIEATPTNKLLNFEEEGKGMLVNFCMQIGIQDS